KGRRLKRLTARNAQVVFSHLHPNALECRACSATARSAIARVHRRRCTATRHLACCLNRYDVLRIFRRPEGRSKGARRKRLRRRLSNGGGQTRLGEVLCALDDHGGVNRTLPKCGRGYDRQGGRRPRSDAEIVGGEILSWSLPLSLVTRSPRRRVRAWS